MPTSNRSDIAKLENIPGPGQYFSMRKADGPAYSLRSRSRDLTSDNVPGPGNYNPNYDSQLEKNPSFKLGTSKRNSSMEVARGPGPCNYSPKGEKVNSGHHFGNSPRNFTYDNKLPGPGSYEFKPALNSISFSMVPRRLSLSVDSTPGPGSYATFDKFSAPNYSLSRTPRKSIAEDNHIPGPGAYTVSFSSHQPKSS